jgi:hypothetical protein
MINTEPHRARCEIGKVRDDSHHLVPAFVPENQIVSGIVNDHVIRVIRECPDAIRDEKAEPPIPESKLSHSKRDACLHRDDRHGDERRPRIAHHQLSDFRVRFNDSARPSRVRLIGFRLIERGLHWITT